MLILVTGGAGFIGCNLVRYLLNETPHTVLNVDKLTYAGNLQSLADLKDNDRYLFSQTDIADAAAIEQLFAQYQPDAVMHLAAESHVDRSIDGPDAFIQTNIVGTFNLLNSAREYYESLPREKQAAFRFLHVSTDEVYGSLSADDPAFTETTRYDPHSPYSASKAASDHLVRAWYDTYQFPVLITNCSNNYGPYQFPEKLIPLVILKALGGQGIPVYGHGENVRDWLYVGDHVQALYRVLTDGRLGQTYNIGGNNEQRNIDLVRELCSLLDEMYPLKDNPEISAARQADINSYADLITFVADRPGHDLRYAIDASKIRDTLRWEANEDFESGLRKTVQWYLAHRDWWQRILSGEYRQVGRGLGQVSGTA